MFLNRLSLLKKPASFLAEWKQKWLPTGTSGRAFREWQHLYDNYWLPAADRVRCKRMASLDGGHRSFSERPVGLPCSRISN